jgi:hypothetical protein
VAQTVQDGMGPWVSEGWWIAGLAAWRLGDCTAAADAFARTAQLSTNAELTAAAHYWNSRALVRCRQPEKATAPLRLAARMDETLYGMPAAVAASINDKIKLDDPAGAKILLDGIDALLSPAAHARSAGRHPVGLAATARSGQYPHCRHAGRDWRGRPG